MSKKGKISSSDIALFDTFKFNFEKSKDPFICLWITDEYQSKHGLKGNYHHAPISKFKTSALKSRKFKRFINKIPFIDSLDDIITLNAEITGDRQKFVDGLEMDIKCIVIDNKKKVIHTALLACLQPEYIHGIYLRRIFNAMQMYQHINFNKPKGAYLKDRINEVTYHNYLDYIIFVAIFRTNNESYLCTI